MEVEEAITKYFWQSKQKDCELCVWSDHVFHILVRWVACPRLSEQPPAVQV